MTYNRKHFNSRVCHQKDTSQPAHSVFMGQKSQPWTTPAIPLLPYCYSAGHLLPKESPKSVAITCTQHCNQTKEGMLPRESWITLQQSLDYGTDITHNWMQSFFFFFFPSGKLFIKMSFKYRIRLICHQNKWLPMRSNLKDPQTSLEHRLAAVP